MIAIMLYEADVAGDTLCKYRTAAWLRPGEILCRVDRSVSSGERKANYGNG